MVRRKPGHARHAPSAALAHPGRDDGLKRRRGRKVADKPIGETSPEEVTGLITGAIEAA